MTQHSSQADTLTIVSGASALISIASIQPLFTLLASLVAIISGIFAIRYYIIKSKKAKKVNLSSLLNLQFSYLLVCH